MNYIPKPLQPLFVIFETGYSLERFTKKLQATIPEVVKNIESVFKEIMEAENVSNLAKRQELFKYYAYLDRCLIYIDQKLSQQEIYQATYLELYGQLRDEKGHCWFYIEEVSPKPPTQDNQKKLSTKS